MKMKGKPAERPSNMKLMALHIRHFGLFMQGISIITKVTKELVVMTAKNV